MIENLTLTFWFREIAESLGHIPLSQSPENSDDGYESEEDQLTATPFQKPEEDVTQWVASQLSADADGRENDEAIASPQWHPDVDAGTSSMVPPPQAIPMVPIQVSV